MFNVVNRKKASAAMAVAAAAVMTVGGLAYFTDRATANAKAVAGSLDIEVAQTWEADNAAVAATFIPGSKLDLKYTVTNSGNKSADIRETFIIKCDEALAGNPAEFELYKKGDVVPDAVNGGYKVDEGKNPVATRTVVDGNTIKYVIDDYVLDGTGTGAEDEVEAASNAKESNYVLFFRGDSANKFQGKNMSVNYLAEAKQHRNTTAETWKSIANETMSFAGDAGYKAVPELKATV